MSELVGAFLVPHLILGLIDREATGLLARRIFLERRQKLSDDRLRRDQDEDVLDEPFDIIARLLLGPLEQVGGR
jgi:hypothetical protein